MKTHRRDAILAAFICLLLSGTLAPASSLTAADILEKASATWRNARTYQANIKMSVEMKTAEGPFSVDMPATVALEKPNKIRMELQNPMGAITMVSDGTTLWVYTPQTNECRISKAPGSLEQDSSLRNQMQAMGLGMFEGLKKEDVAKELGKSVKSFGIRALDGRRAHVVQIAHPQMGTMKFWIGEKDFQLYKMEVDMSKMMSGILGSEAGGDQNSMKMTVLFTGAKMDEAIPAGTFSFQVPEGV